MSQTCSSIRIIYFHFEITTLFYNDDKKLTSINVHVFYFQNFLGCCWNLMWLLPAFGLYFAHLWTRTLCHFLSGYFTLFSCGIAGIVCSCFQLKSTEYSCIYYEELMWYGLTLHAYFWMSVMIYWTREEM